MPFDLTEKTPSGDPEKLAAGNRCSPDAIHVFSRCVCGHLFNLGRPTSIKTTGFELDEVGRGLTCPVCGEPLP